MKSFEVVFVPLVERIRIMRSPDDGWLGLGLLPFLIAGGTAFAVGLAAVGLRVILIPRIAAVVCGICGARILWEGRESPFFVVMGLILLVGTSFWFMSRKPRSKS
jgi:hypothetical protein